MRVSYFVGTVAKRGNAPRENEDAVWPVRNHDSILVKDGFRCALADGATQAAFSSLWARLLTREVTRRRVSRDKLRLAVDEARIRWRKSIDIERLSWAALDRLQSGAYATLVRLELLPVEIDAERLRRWYAFAVGDVCLFHLRDHTLLRSYPISDPDAFSNSPLALATMPIRNAIIWDQNSEFEHSGFWEPRDSFLLMTDALAKWFLTEQMRGANPVAQIDQIILAARQSPGAFSDWIAQLYDMGNIRNDDATLVLIQPEE